MTRPEIIKLISNTIFVLLMMHLLFKHDGVKYKSRRKGFWIGMMLMRFVMVRGAVMTGIPFFNK